MDANANNWKRKKFINEHYSTMIGIPKESNPVQINRILSEAYSREKLFRPPDNPRFVIPTIRKLRDAAVTKPPNKTNEENSDEEEDQLDSSTDVTYRSRRLDSAELDRISVSLPPRRRHCSSAPGMSDLDMDELTSVVSGKSRSSSMVGGLYYPIDTPLTSSHEIGWVVCPEISSQKWRKPKVTDSIVRYAEIYYEQNRINPFKRPLKPPV